MVVWKHIPPLTIGNERVFWTMRILIFGIGNLLRKDDGVGIRIAVELQKDKDLQSARVEIKGGNIEPFDLLKLIDGYDRLILIDAIKTENGSVGEIHQFKLENLPSYPLRTSHGVDLMTAIEIGKMEYQMPKIIDIYAVEISDGNSFGEELTLKLGERFFSIVQEILKKLKSYIKDLEIDR